MSSVRELSGLLVALITPFTEDGLQINKESLKEQVDRLIKAGVHGLVPAGGTGECMALDLGERKALTELVIQYTAGRIPVVPGVGCVTTKNTVELAKHAAQAGADAVMVVPTYYEPCSIDHLHQHLLEVYQAARIPIVFYNVPGVTGLALSPEQLDGLSKCGVKYIKDTSGNAPALTDLLFRRENITAFNGWDTMTFFALAAGAKGAVWGAPNIIPELCVELWNTLAVKKNLDEAKLLWQKILPICQALESTNYVCAVKSAVQLQGYETGPLRKPFAHITGEEKQQIVKALSAAGVKTIK
ncbi:hypothetical protein N7541_005029 [Penicillium brevicompactum]|uniref:4-hydroxy-tetrahydrodipicolinate synthase n=1 Tax=Penicillium brevicompactum TaxID=5074 RepID=A0A9W9RCY3_PENBR|nr:hypothetical protein N7541_005029 [Penicillium brevicompactum]